MKRKAVMRLGFPSERQVEIVLRALKPEARNPPTKRSQATLDKEDNFLILRIKAMDTVALRAATNAYLRWIRSMKDTLELLQNLS